MPKPPKKPFKATGKDFVALSKAQRLEMYEHVLYELASAFCPPVHENNSEVRESIYLRVMIAVRNLTHFFTFDEMRSYVRDDVFAWQFFEPTEAGTFRGVGNAPKIDREDLDKINKQIAHISLARASFKGAAKRWRVELRDELKSFAMRFIETLFDERSTEIPKHLVRVYQQLYRFLRYRMSHTRSVEHPTSNTAFEVLLWGDPNVTHCEPLEITTLLAAAPTNEYQSSLPPFSPSEAPSL